MSEREINEQIMVGKMYVEWCAIIYRETLAASLSSVAIYSLLLLAAVRELPLVSFSSHLSFRTGHRPGHQVVAGKQGDRGRSNGGARASRCFRRISIKLNIKTSIFAIRPRFCPNFITRIGVHNVPVGGYIHTYLQEGNVGYREDE